MGLVSFMTHIIVLDMCQCVLLKLVGVVLNFLLFLYYTVMGGKDVKEVSILLEVLSLSE